jgi:putative ABC transport system permease protein
LRTFDHIEQAWANLRKMKLRTFLTTSGVVIGVGALVCMFAFGQGIQQNIRNQFSEMGLLNYISVSVKNGVHPGRRGYDPDEPHPDARHDEPPEKGESTATVLDEQVVKEISQIDGVEAVFPEMRFPAQIRLGKQEQFTLVQVLSAEACRSGLVQLRAGRSYASDEPNELIVSDTFLRRMGTTQPKAAIGKQIEIRTLSLDFSVLNLLRMIFVPGGQGLPLSSRSYSFTIAGVAQRMSFGGSLPLSSDVLIPLGPAGRMQKLELTSIWDFFEPADRSGTYSTMSVKVASQNQVEFVQQKLRERGLRTFALVDQLQEMKVGFAIMDMFLLAVGMIGITVASLGIVNTMVMSILERYREIGVMKAVGATDGDVQKIFLFESGLIGLLGGIGGLVLARLVSFVINAVVNGFTTGQGVPYIHYFNFPLWLCIGAVLFSVLVSLIAGIYPTLRAARVDPVVALRHD